jgi:hypothetical protein
MMDRIEELERRVALIEMALKQARMMPEPAPRVVHKPNTQAAPPTATNQ